MITSYRYSDELKLLDLIGKRITSIEISQCDLFLLIKYESKGQPFYMILQGNEDCHIVTHWESIEGRDCLVDADVMFVGLTDQIETHPTPEGYPDYGQYEIEGEVYQAIVISTHKGRCQIEMRTENEQYYGLSYSVFVNEMPYVAWDKKKENCIPEDSLPWKEFKDK